MKNERPSPTWLQTGRAFLFEGWTPPLLPDLEFDADRMIRAMKSANVNVVRFPANTLNAFFPSRHMAAYSEMKGRDIFGEALTATREAGFRFVAYIGLATGVGDENAKAHPDWLQLDENGNIRSKNFFQDDPATPFWYDICSHRPAYRKAICAFTREILDRYEVDGVYFDGPYYWTHCYCPDCLASYAERVGEEYPRIYGMLGDYPKRPPSPEIDTRDPRMQRYLQWHFQLEQELCEELAGIVRNHPRNAALLFHGNGIYKIDYMKPSNHLKLADGILAEHGENFQHRYASAILSSAVGKPMWAYTGAFNFHTRVWNQGAEYKQEGFSSFSAGTLPAVAAGNRLYYDLSGVKHVKEVFDFQQEHSRLLNEVRTVPWAAVPYTDANGKWYNGWYLRNAYNMGHLSACATLLDAYVPTAGLLNEDVSDLETLQRYRAIFLADFAAMSDREADAITQYVKQGGTLLATGLTSALDEMARPRCDFALKDLFQCHLVSPSNRAGDTYVRFRDGHPALKGISSGSMLPCLYHARVEANAKANVLADLLYGAENVAPAVVANEFGKGKVLFLPAALERTYVVNSAAGGAGGYLYDRNPVLRRFFQSAMRWLTGDTPIEAPDESGLWIIPAQNADGDKILVHLINRVCINYDKSHVIRRRLFEYPGPSIRVRVNVKPNSVKTLRSEENLAYRYHKGKITFRVPDIQEYEGVLIE